MSTDYKFEGWLGKDKNAIGNMSHEAFEPRPWAEDLIDIQISHSGICGSDLHVLRSGWGETDYPCIVGHEIVGKAVKVGSKVKSGIKVGDTVGVGAQNEACLKPDCMACSEQDENHCPHMRGTYDDRSIEGNHKIYGGYANYHRANGHLVFKIPDGLPLEMAAPMMCGGVTTYTPIVEANVGPESSVAIVGLGGLGHFGVLWAKAFGAKKIVVISRTHAKEVDARKMGATDFIATNEDKDWEKTHESSMDLIVNTVSDHKMPIAGYLNLLKRRGKFVQVGAPEDAIPGFNMFSLIGKSTSISGSPIGSPKQIRDMLNLAVEKKVQAWIQQRPMKDANSATVDMENGKARYRYCLVN